MVPDAELVHAIRKGDPVAADQLVRRHYRAAYAVAYAVLCNVPDAEDACQDAFVRALERIDDCRDPERFVYWMLRIVRNHALNLLDRRRVRSGPSLDDVDSAGPGDSSYDASSNELKALLERALAKLSPVQREVILLKHLEGWDHRAIAATVDISEGMSRQHAFEARRVLQQELGEGFLKDYFGD